MSLFTLQAKEAMAALSTQIIQYMKKNNITPNKPKLIRSDILDSFTDDQTPKLLAKSPSRASLISVKTAGKKYFCVQIKVDESFMLRKIKAKYIIAYKHQRESLEIYH